MSYSHEYYVTHKEKYLESQRKYLAKKKAENEKEFLAERNEYMKEYYKNHPEHRAVSALCKEIRTDRRFIDYEFDS